MRSQASSRQPAGHDTIAMVGYISIGARFIRIKSYN
jgi:hypothetical protein